MTQSSTLLAEPLTLQNGSVLKNRIGKAAMEESLCDENHGPSVQLISLYQKWGQSGAGMLLTGNVMIDRTALTGPSNVVVENDSNMAGLKTWAAAGKAGGAQMWAQINHPGRQVFAMVTQEPVAPSAVAVEIKGAKDMFATPRALTEDEISDIIKRFAATATVMETAGFDGIQLHGAHGYLISQFLSPHSNRRTDQWGGSIENRARLLIQAVRAVRASVGKDFGVAVKLNSADFQKGGFTEDDAEQVIKMLNAEKLDYLEISGGTYEAPAMTGAAGDEIPTDLEKKRASTIAREAYFLDFAKKARAYAKMPLMVTGGFRSLSGMEAALKDGALDIVGMAKPFSENPNIANDLLSGAVTRIDLKKIKLPIAALTSMAEMAWAKTQMHRIAAQKRPNPYILGPFFNLISTQIAQRKAAKKYRAWLKTG